MSCIPREDVCRLSEGPRFLLQPPSRGGSDATERHPEPHPSPRRGPGRTQDAGDGQRAPGSAGTEVEVFTRIFGALPSGRRELVAWLLQHRVTAAVMEATGIYWEAPFEALEDAGIPALLMNAQQVKQIRGRKTGIGEGAWLATSCQFGPGSLSMIPPPRFRRLRKVSRLRRQLVGDSARLRNRIHKVVDAAGIRIGGVLSDVFGVNGLRILDGLTTGRPAEAIVASLSPHVGPHLRNLQDALTARRDDDSRFLPTDLVPAWRPRCRLPTSGSKSGERSSGTR